MKEGNHYAETQDALEPHNNETDNSKDLGLMKNHVSQLINVINYTCAFHGG